MKTIQADEPLAVRLFTYACRGIGDDPSPASELPALVALLELEGSELCIAWPESDGTAVEVRVLRGPTAASSRLSFRRRTSLPR